MKGKMYVATRKGLFTVDRQESGGWTVNSPSFLGDPVSIVLEDVRDGTLYAALNLGHFGVKLRRSSNGGEAWTECGTPAFPEEPVESSNGPTEPEPKAPSLRQIWCLETGGPDQPGLLWAGTIPGGLFRSLDGGENWSLIESLWNRPERKEWFGGGYDEPGIHSIIVDPRDADHVVIGISCGGVWVTRDGGKTWECKTTGMHAEYMPPERREDPNIQDPHRVVACAAAPDALWTQHHNGIFRSVDGAERWTEITNIEPSKFGFTVAVHPRDPETAWFVPAVKDECRVPVDGKVVVARTRDGGKSFDVLGNGLPQRHAYDLVYRHAFDIDASGDALAMGSTTGGLWVTEDGGDSWSCISSQLPPIYQVRFGA